MLKYERVKQQGFERLREKSERQKENMLEKLWHLIGKGKVEVWDYMVGISLVHQGDYPELRRHFSTLNINI